MNPMPYCLLLWEKYHSCRTLLSKNYRWGYIWKCGTGYGQTNFIIQFHKISWTSNGFMSHRNPDTKNLVLEDSKLWSCFRKTLILLGRARVMSRSSMTRLNNSVSRHVRSWRCRVIEVGPVSSLYRRQASVFLSIEGLDNSHGLSSFTYWHAWTTFLRHQDASATPMLGSLVTLGIIIAESSRRW